MKPEVAEFTFDEHERAAIAVAMSTPKPWTHKAVADVRRRIREFHLKITEDTCCYCQRDLNGEFKLVIDVEHILPSSQHNSLTFEIWNLSASCKRCNMGVKKDDVSFLQGHGSLRQSARYRIVHPNFDNVEDHLQRLVVQAGRTRIVKYVTHTPEKGRFTYEYFRLRDLEVDSYDQAQGANAVGDEEGRVEAMRSRVEALLETVRLNGRRQP